MLIFVLLLQGAQAILQNKWAADPREIDSTFNAYARVKLFYHEDPRADVVFIGNSHVYMGINPLHIYRMYGISSYVLGSPNQDAGTNKLYVQEALKQKEVTVIVLDAHRIFDFWNGEVQHRRWVDPLPLSVNKMKYIWDTLKRNEVHGAGIEYDSWLSFVFPVLRYHERWEKLTANDFYEDPVVLYYHGAVHYHGFGTHYKSIVTNYDHYYDSVSIDNVILEETKVLFREIVSMCKEKGVELLLIKTPSPAWRQDYHELVSAWAQEYNIPFIDYNEQVRKTGNFYRDRFL